jgi:hypothetical protein
VGDERLAAAQRERRAFSMLRRGDPLGALAEAGSGPPNVRLALLAAEARLCLGRGDLDELEELQHAVAGRGDATLALRLEAAFAELHAIRGDPMCEAIATRALEGIADERLRAPDALWARGRLRRTLALAEVLIGPDRPPEAEHLMEQAKADFRQAGFDAERARCAAELRFAWALAFGEDVQLAADTVTECLSWQRQMGTGYVDLVLAYRIVLDLARGDFPAVAAGAGELDLLAVERPLHPVARALASFVRLATRLLAEGPTAGVLATADEHLAVVRSEVFPGLASQFAVLGGLMIDAGHIRPEDLRLARRWAAQAAAGAPNLPKVQRELASLLARIDLIERGDLAAVEAVDADLEAGRRLDLRRDVAQRGLRAALAARRAGRHDVAERLHREAIADLPPVEDRLVWENALVGLVEGTSAPATAAAARLLLLGPTVRAGVGGAVRPLSTALARLVVALVAEGGAAPAERLVDTLWPDAAPESGRARLRVALHRLRSALRDGAGEGVGSEADGSAPADPVTRRGGIVALAPHVDVDVATFEKLAAGSIDDRRAAIDVYEGEVARVQLAYDDVAAPLRRRLAATWRQTAREALADPGLARARIVRIATVAASSAEEDPEMADLLAVAERRMR